MASRNSSLQIKLHTTLTHSFPIRFSDTAQKMKFSMKDFFSKCDQIRSFLRIFSGGREWVHKKRMKWTAKNTLKINTTLYKNLILKIDQKAALQKCSGVLVFSPPKGVLKICNKFTGEHPCRSVISTKLFCR